MDSHVIIFINKSMQVKFSANRYPVSYCITTLTHMISLICIGCTHGFEW